MNNKILEIQELKLVNGNDHLLSDFSLTLSHNERVGITGPSGCGKTTLLKSIVGSEFPKGSSAKFFLKDSTILSSYIPQNNGLMPWFSLQKNISIFSRDTEFTDKIITIFNLKNCLSNFPHQLSGGEYQRAILAAALNSNPNFYIADEPLTELDIKNKWVLLSFWSKHISDTKASLLVISHDIETLVYLCDRIVVLSDKPATILKEIKVLINHPRSVDFLVSDEFNKVKKELFNIINNA